MLTAYLDETGHESRDYVFIAGFLGNDEQWHLCAREWKAALGNRAGLHMKRLRWSNPRTARLLASLGPIPRQCGLEPMVGGVRVCDYSDMKLGWAGLKLARGYINALFPLVIQALRSIPKSERLELVFEEQREYEPIASLVLSEAARMPDAEFRTENGLPKLAKWSFVPKNSTILTQPADYFAYALTQLYRNKHSERTKMCMSILGDENSTAIGAVWKREQIRGNSCVNRNVRKHGKKPPAIPLVRLANREI